MAWDRRVMAWTVKKRLKVPTGPHSSGGLGRTAAPHSLQGALPRRAQPASGGPCSPADAWMPHRPPEAPRLRAPRPFKNPPVPLVAHHPGRPDPPRPPHRSPCPRRGQFLLFQVFLPSSRPLCRSYPCLQAPRGTLPPEVAPACTEPERHRLGW